MSYYERDLPHWHPEGRTIFLTWRLYGSLPRDVRRRLEGSQQSAGKQFAIADRCLDTATDGPRWLREPKVAECVRDVVLRGADMKQYVLHAYVLMPNHVHILLDPIVDMPRIVRGIKGVSSRDANRVLGRVGKPFWQDESFDHWIRSPAEFEKVRGYIERNPVQAGLAAKPEDWRWSSAHR
jgi:REP element-mobilizing transposase RayT